MGRQLRKLSTRHLNPNSAPADAPLKDPQPGESVELDSQNRHDEDPQGGMYARVNHPRSRLKQRTDTSPSSLSGGLLDISGRQAEESRHMDSQAAASDTPQDVTYAQLNLLALREKTSAPPFSPSEEPPDEPCVYTALAIP
ncbi:leukocyte immunoglobulin-like receptor subfamily B member 4 [Molossus nigricans]